MESLQELLGPYVLPRRYVECVRVGSTNTALVEKKKTGKRQNRHDAVSVSVPSRLPIITATRLRFLSDMSKAKREVIDLVSSSEDENDAPLRRNLNLPPHGKRGREMLSSHVGRLTKKGGGKKVHPTDASLEEYSRSCGLKTQGLPSSHADPSRQDNLDTGGRPSQNGRIARVHPVPWIFINADGSDDAIVTEGIISLADMLHLPDVATCAGGKKHRQSVSSVLHIKQNDKWSCGFRNLQMMLSALLPRLPAFHPFFEVVPDSLKRYPATAGSIPTPLPSLRQLQSFLEQSWADGFDPRGAQHYNRRIVGKRSEIGAVEVSSCLSFLGIDSTVVQFIKCKESRSLLGSFVWAYFTKMAHRNGCVFCSDTAEHHDHSLYFPSTTECALELLRSAAVPSAEDATTESCSCPVLPLYLQWEGHSVSIVGAERKVIPNASTNGIHDINLLLFDPMVDGEHIKQSLVRAVASKSTASSMASNKFLSSIRLPAHKLLEKDCQILMSSMRSLTPNEKKACRESINAVTAAKSEVVRFLE